MKQQLHIHTHTHFQHFLKNKKIDKSQFYLEKIIQTRKTELTAPNNREEKQPQTKVESHY